jgi:hypothetical protein
MERQKIVQKEWYENRSTPKGGEIIEISTRDHIERLKALVPVRRTVLSLNCGCGSGLQRDLFGPSIGVDISFENIRSLVKVGGVKGALLIWNTSLSEIMRLTWCMDLGYFII